MPHVFTGEHLSATDAARAGQMPGPGAEPCAAVTAAITTRARVHAARPARGSRPGRPGNRLGQVRAWPRRVRVRLSEVRVRPCRVTRSARSVPGRARSVPGCAGSLPGRAGPVPILASPRHPPPRGPSAGDHPAHARQHRGHDHAERDPGEHPVAGHHEEDPERQAQQRQQRMHELQQRRPLWTPGRTRRLKAPGHLPLRGDPSREQVDPDARGEHPHRHAGNFTRLPSPRPGARPPRFRGNARPVHARPAAPAPRRRAPRGPRCPGTGPTAQHRDTPATAPQ